MTEGESPALLRWDRRIRPFIIVAALVPLMGVGNVTETLPAWAVGIDFVCWVVFAVDLVVRVRIRHRYLRTGWGLFDLFVVVGTFPWYVFLGAPTRLVTLLRLARLLRVIELAVRLPRTRQLVERLNKAALYTIAALVVFSFIAWRADDEVSGFDSYGDALWWGMVTITTVGYGDIVPESTAGRLAAVALMLSGLALLGATAGSLASFFGIVGGGRLRGGPDPDGDDEDGQGTDGASDDGSADEVLTELRALRAEVAELRRAVADRGEAASPENDP